MNSGATAGTINSSVFGNATLTLTGSGSFNGVIANGAGTVNLVKNTGGNEILNGISTYSGTTILSGGTLTLNGITNQSGAFTNAVAGTGTIIFNGGYLSNGADPANTLTVANRLSVPAGNVGTIIMGNRIALGSNATGTLTGGGVLNMVISSNVTRDDIKGDFGLFTGTVNLYGNGTARVGQNFGNASRSVFNMPSGWLELNDSVNLSPQDNSGGNAYPIGALSSSSPNAVIQLPGAGGVGSLQVGLLNKDSTFAGSIQGNNSLAKLGTGKMVLTGNNSFTNATIVGTDSSTLPGVPGGSLVIGSGGNLSGTTAITVNDGATFAMAGTGTLTSVATLSLRATGAFDVTGEPGWSTPKGLTVTGSNIVGAQPKIFSSGHYLHNAGTINPGAVGGAGTMNFQNGLDLHGGIAALDLSGAGAGANQTMLGGGFNDLIDVSNGLSITPSSLRINFINGTPTTGSVYPIARYDSLTDGNGVPITTSGTLNGWDILGAAAGNYILQNDNANKELTLTFTTNPNFTTQDLICTGTTSGVWETGTSNNWKDSTTSVASPFFLGDSVNFLDQGGVTTITLNAVMSPSKVTVNSDNLNYAFIGSGGIAGTGALIKDGAGTLILGNTTSSSYSGGTFLKKGTIDLNAAGVLVNTTTLGSGPIHMSDQTTLIGSGLLSDTSQPDIPQAIILDAGANATFNSSKRGGLSGTLSVAGGGSATLNILVPFIRTQLTGNGSAFSGTLNVMNTPTVPFPANAPEFRINNVFGYPNATVNLGSATLTMDVIAAIAGFSNGFGETLGEVTGVGNLGGSNGNATPFTWTVGRSTDFTFGGQIVNTTGPTNIIKQGTSTWSLTGASTNTGSFGIVGGTLKLDGGTLQTGLITASTGGTFAIGGGGGNFTAARSTSSQTAEFSKPMTDSARLPT